MINLISEKIKGSTNISCYYSDFLNCWEQLQCTQLKLSVIELTVGHEPLHCPVRHIMDGKAPQNIYVEI